MDIMILIQIITCIASVASVITIYRNNQFQKGNLEFSISQRRGSYYFDASDTKITGVWEATCCAVISLKVVNKSAYPVAIDNAMIKKNNYKTEHYNEFSFENIYVKESSESEKCRDAELNANLPLKLEAFETKYFSLSFPFFEDFVSYYGENVDITLIINTSKGKYDMAVNIPEYYTLFELLPKKSSSNSASDSSLDT